MTSSFDAFPYTSSMEGMSFPQLLIGTRLVTWTRLLSVEVALTPGLYPGLGIYAGPSFYPKLYSILYIYDTEDHDIHIAATQLNSQHQNTKGQI